MPGPTTGRVIGFTASSINDPDLPPVVVSEGEARRAAEKQTRLSSDSTLFLAQLVEGEWRPGWLVGSGDKDVVIDAAPGGDLVVCDARTPARGLGRTHRPKGVSTLATAVLMLLV